MRYSTKFQEIGISNRSNNWTANIWNRIVIPVAMVIGLNLICAYRLEGQVERTRDFKFNPGADLPVDPDVVLGKLENGLTYYIRENRKPENRAEVWLVVNAGSVLEEENQRGLAHFLEHMAFNRTENFEKHEIIDYLESIGMQFGPEVNAYTGFDETVYMLQLPTDSAGVMETGFRILGEWAHRIVFEPEEVEGERGVVIEEWRLGRGAGMRMLDQQLPVIFMGSRYAERLPIGDVQLLDTFDIGSLERFYRDWYRPDLMAVIAVGDFNAGEIRELIREEFSAIPAAENPKPRTPYPVPDHEETLFTLASDKEATSTMVSLLYKNDVLPEATVSDYRRMLTEQLFSRMLNGRLYELLNQADPPYLYAFSTRSDMVRTKMVYSLDVAVKEDGIRRGFEALMTEAVRARDHGFTTTELERTKAWFLRRMEQAYQERDKSESSGFASEYMRNFLEDEPIPGTEYEYRAVNALLPEITVKEVNQMAGRWLGRKNRVILLNAPDKEELELPDEQKMLSWFDEIDRKQTMAYEDLDSSEPLMEELQTGAEIISESEISELGLTIWELSNGIHVLLKPTDFQNDEIQFQGFSPGGTSLVPNSMYRSARAATDIVMLGGLAGFDLNTLNKKLAGKLVSVFPYISGLSEGVVGNASPEDMETLFQLIYLYLTRPRPDSAAYFSYLTRMQGMIENRFSSPENAFYDTVQVTLGNYHFRERPWSLEMLEEIDPVQCTEVYRDRFADAGDFTFVFVGNFNPDTIRPLVKTYLGSLPSTGRKETWKDVGVRSPGGVIRKTVYRGVEPKGRVSLIFSGDYQWGREENYVVASMVSVLRIKLREVLREDLSGTYGTSVSSSTLLYPREEYRISISFGCDPERVDELVTTVFSVIDSLKTCPVESEYIIKVAEAQRRSYEVNLEQNGYWLSSLVNYAFRDHDPRLILEFPDLVETLDVEMIRETANRYFDSGNYIQIVLLPEILLKE